VLKRGGLQQTHGGLVGWWQGWWEALGSCFTNKYSEGQPVSD